MTVTQVSIGQVKRDISELVNRVAFGEERIILTSRGKPKAAIVSIEDLTRLTDEHREQRKKEWNSWLAKNKKLSDSIQSRREGEFVDVDLIWDASRSELEARHGE